MVCTTPAGAPLELDRLLPSHGPSAIASRGAIPVGASGLPSPAGLKAGAVASPGGSDARSPRKLVPGSEGWPPPGAEGDLELLPEEEVFEKQVMPAAKSPRYDGEQKPKKFELQVRITDRPRD